MHVTYHTFASLHTLQSRVVVLHVVSLVQGQRETLQLHSCAETGQLLIQVPKTAVLTTTALLESWRLGPACL
jgi:hypothetical protein